MRLRHSGQEETLGDSQPKINDSLGSEQPAGPAITWLYQRHHGDFGKAIETHRVDGPADSPRDKHGVAFGRSDDTVGLCLVSHRKHRRTPEGNAHLAAMSMTRQNQIDMAGKVTVCAVRVVAEHAPAGVIRDVIQNLVETDMVFPQIVPAGEPQLLAIPFDGSGLAPHVLGLARPDRYPRASPGS